MNLYILFLSLLLSVCSAGTGKTYNDDAQLMVLDNKFKNNEPVDLENIIFTSTEEKLSSSSPCHQDLDLVWHASLPPLTASPILVDLEGDGKKEVLVATSLHYIEMIQGEDGSKTTGWPFGFPRSAFVSSPITYDIDRDGIDDIVVTSHDGEIVFLRNNGQPHYNKTLVVPPLPIHRNWFEGLDLVNSDVSVNLMKPAKQTRKKEKRSTLELNIDDDDDEDNTYTDDAVKAMNTMLSDMTAKDKKIDDSGFFTDPALQSLELFLPSSTPDTYISHLRTQQDPLYSPSYLSYLKKNLESWPKEKQREYILVDAHVLSTPVIADLDGDGNQELIATVSYYFDQEYYNDQVHRASKIPQDIDMANYVAGAIIVFDLQKLEIKWLHDYTAYRAYMYSSPTVADFDNDGTLEIVVSTALGLIYVFNFDGTARGDNFPIMMDAIYAPVTLEDINGDGALELIAVDANSNIVCYDTKGSVLWENRLSGFPDEAPVIGDVDGNGILDVVVGTNEGHIWAFQGTDGKQVSNFPVKLKGRIESQLLLIDAEREREGEGKGMKIVVHDLDGHVYVIEGATGCSDKIDIDDLTGNGFLDLLVSTSSGNIYCLGTSIPFHPSTSWLSQDQSRNGFIAGKHRGIYVLEQSRQFRDITGSHFYVSFEIVDKSYSDGKAYKYDVIIRHGGVHLFGKRYYTPGVYTEQIPVPNERAQVTMTVEMINKHGIASFDSFGVSFNLQFHRTIKWIIIGPFALIALILLFVNDLKKQPLL